MSSPITPSEADLTSALSQLRLENPTLGISKVHSLLLSKNPEWTVSEKRTRKILQSQGLTLTSATAKAKEGIKKYPSSKVIDKLNVDGWTNKVEVRFFDKKKGKGLIAKDDISEGEVIWKEDPFAIAPEWEIYNLISTSLACAFCTTPLGDSSLIVPCHSSSSTTHCPARFCNRLCQSRSQKLNHPLLCPARNPGSTPLIQFAKENGWLGLHALAQCTGRILLAIQESGGEGFEEDWRVFSSFAALGMEERGVWMGTREPLHPIWNKAFSLYQQAFWEPSNDTDKKKLAKILKRPLDGSVKKRIGDDLFTYNTFLRNLGRMSLNLEGHGGLYTLHSHINHSCTPNVSVRHLHRSTSLARISIVAKRNIEKGEEIFVSYVDPSIPLHLRREKLKEWSFGNCECTRCIEEEREMPEQTITKASAVPELDELERELKQGFGVF